VAVRWRAALEVAANASVVVASGVLVWVLVGPGAAFRVRQTPRAAPPSYAVGERFAAVAGLEFARAPLTLIVWVRSTCRYCTESMGFYRRLAAAPRRARVVVVGAEPVERLREYVGEHGFAPDEVVSVGAEAVKLPVTPMLVLVDAEGIVRAVWRGKLGSAAEEAAVLAEVRNADDRN
jgi:hypothetical protein